MADARTSVPGEPAGQRATGWFKSPDGGLFHADGPSQVRALLDRGWTEIEEAEAKTAVAAGTHLEVGRADTAGTFDADAVRDAVRDEGSQSGARSKAARSAAARKGAATKAAKAAAKNAEAEKQSTPDPAGDTPADS